MIDLATVVLGVTRVRHLHQQPPLEGTAINIKDGQVVVQWDNGHLTFSEPSSLELA